VADLQPKGRGSDAAAAGTLMSTGRDLTPMSDDLLVEPGAVLLLDDTPGDALGHYCEQSLTAGGAADRAELLVTFPGPDDRIGLDERHNSRQPAKRGVIAVSDSVEARRIAAEDPDFSEPVVTDAVLDRGDLRGLGLKISRYCEALAKAGFDITVCVDGLSELLSANEPEHVFKFAHALAERLEALDAVAHFHLDPEPHDQRVVGTFEEMFAGVFVEFEPDESTVDTADRTATDADVARSTGGSAAESGRETPDSEATDDDIAEALEDS
jgi:hypothetical protein